MLILAKSVLGLMLGFVLSLVAAVILIPLLKKLHVGQSVSKLINERHLKKDGTPTIGGLIFIIPTILIMLILYLRGSIEFNSNLIILIFVFLAYGALGFIDDFLKVKYHNNDGLSIGVKFLLQTAIAVVFYIIYRNNGGDSNLVISSLGINVSLGWAFGLFILLVLVGTTNAVNISDGLDGLAGGISSIFFLTIGIIAFFQGRIGLSVVIAFIMLGSTLGFLVHNFHPAKIFMGDSGSMFLGFIIAVITLLGFKTIITSSIIIPLCILIVPILDTICAIIRRKLKGESIGTPDKSHFHHQLLRRNCSVSTAVLIIYLITALFSSASIIWLLVDNEIGYIIYGILMLGLMIFVFRTDILFDHKKDRK